MKLCSSAEIAKAGMEVAQLAAKHRLTIREFAEDIPETRKPEDPEFVLKAMGALALFDNFKWIIIREGHKLNLVTADASDVGKPNASVDPEEQEISKQMDALKVRLEHKRRAKIVRPLTPAALDEFVDAPGNAKWMRETTASLKKFLESNEEEKGEMLAKKLWEVMLVSKDNYKEKYPSGGHSVTGGSHKGTGKQPQSRVTARSTKELERLGARTWIEATQRDSGSRSWRTSPTTALRGATTHMKWRRAPRGLVENVETATGYGTLPPEGGGGGGMAEDSPNRFLWHEGEVQGESEDDDIPREWPAYRRVYAALCRA